MKLASFHSHHEVETNTHSVTLTVEGTPAELDAFLARVAAPLLAGNGPMIVTAPPAEDKPKRTRTPAAAEPAPVPVAATPAPAQAAPPPAATVPAPVVPAPAAAAPAATKPAPAPAVTVAAAIAADSDDAPDAEAEDDEPPSADDVPDDIQTADKMRVVLIKLVEHGLTTREEIVQWCVAYAQFVPVLTALGANVEDRVKRAAALLPMPSEAA
jgi:hypothetical protein